MPRSAISSGNVDLILTPRAIAEELARISGHPYVRRQTEPNPSKDGKEIVLTLLLAASGVDFKQYRQTTLLRRIQRRMVLNRTEDFDVYVDLLQKNPAELEALYQDILIHVTSFFREPEIFETLRETVFPELIKAGTEMSQFGFGCPDARPGKKFILLRSVFSNFWRTSQVTAVSSDFWHGCEPASRRKCPERIFGEAIESEVSPERLRSFFTRIDRGYQINKPIRDMCVFARQDVTRDPPFSKMDLISCRNVMIYFEPELQHRLIPLFHYALKSSGFLLLGTAENIGRFSHLFDVVTQKSKLFRKRPGQSAVSADQRIRSCLFRLLPRKSRAETQEIGT